jgi:D-alanine--poly(phosphoribitol) ligase subunit 1
MDFIELIKENAKNNPERVAVIDGDKKVNYADFILMVNSISNQLSPKLKVVLDLKQSVESYALIVAILNVGGTYCPLNPSAPFERKRQIVTEFAPDIIIVDSIENNFDMISHKVTTISILLSIKSNSEVLLTHNGDDIIYIIYTSGSSGVSKGVQICRKALSKFLEWSIPTYAATENDIWAQFSLLSFDLSIVDIFTCLCSGATLYVISDLTAKTYRPDRIIEKAKITIWHSVPSVIEFMIVNNRNKSCDFSSLKLMSFCGDTLKKHQVEFLIERNNNLRIFNTYGPTEGTLFCTWQEVNFKNFLDFSNYSISIGKAIPGWNLQLNSVEGYEDKEVTIFGDYIGKGYLLPGANNKFKTIKVGEDEFSAFETGDMVKEINGSIYFVGRKDNQVKLKGFRVELDEIDFRIFEFLKLNSVTIVNNDTLYTFIETESSINDTELRGYLKTVLESYKIPHSFYLIPEIPRNQNHKTDINTLKSKLNEKNLKTT